jgi:alkylation response protein AidB-like acyl-CoA dehydrogenase
MRKLGLHGATTVQLALEDCRVPAANLLGAEGEGFKIAMQVLDVGRMGIAAQAVGIAQAALDIAVDYAGVREQFGRRIGQFQGLRWRLADVHARLEAARLLTYHAARLREAGEPYTLAAATAKLQASAAAVFAADVAVQVHGGYGYMSEAPAERLLRDAKITEIYEGTSEIQRVVIARHLLPGLREV